MRRMTVVDNETDCNASFMNEFQDNIEEAIEVSTSNVTIATAVAQNTNYTIPLSYKVGANCLDVYCFGEKLVKDVHYIEVTLQENNQNLEISNVIQFKDWGQSVPVGTEFEFVVRGSWGENE